MREPLAEDVYDTLLGEMEEWARIPGVENEFAEGKRCAELYERMYEAKLRLYERLGEEDKDIDCIVDAFMELCREVGCKMYEYGGKRGSAGN